MAVDRRKGCQVACKVVKLKSQSQNPVVSHHFKAVKHASLAGIEAASWKEPSTIKLWREVELLKIIRHVSLSELHLIEPKLIISPISSN